jgi:hypothetical protein
VSRVNLPTWTKCMSRCLQREVQRDNSARRFVGNFS